MLHFLHHTNVWTKHPPQMDRLGHVQTGQMENQELLAIKILWFEMIFFTAHDILYQHQLLPSWWGNGNFHLLLPKSASDGCPADEVPKICPGPSRCWPTQPRVWVLTTCTVLQDQPIPRRQKQTFPKPGNTDLCAALASGLEAAAPPPGAVTSWDCLSRHA